MTAATGAGRMPMEACHIIHLFGGGSLLEFRRRLRRKLLAAEFVAKASLVRNVALPRINRWPIYPARNPSDSISGAA